MILLLDIGNTRIKWATLDQGTLGAQRAQVYADWGHEQLRKHLFEATKPIQRILVANVAGKRIADLLQEAAQSLNLTPEFLHSTSSAGGVRNAYVDPKQLGVDRWMALIGAHALQARATCIVDVGTAMTVDGIDALGRHLGGVIVPGPDLMMSSLMRNTSDIALRAEAGRYGEALFADNTLGGVYQGAVHALAALIERAVAHLARECGEAPVLLLTGGARDGVKDLLQTPAQIVPDLVLRGLAVLAAA